MLAPPLRVRGLSLGVDWRNWTLAKDFLCLVSSLAPEVRCGVLMLWNWVSVLRFFPAALMHRKADHANCNRAARGLFEAFWVAITVSKKSVT